MNELAPADNPCARIDGLSIAFRTQVGRVLAVRDVSLALRLGETYGLVGESGCGKSTIAYALAGHLAPAATVLQGRIDVLGQDILRCTSAERRRLRGPGVAMVHQDPVGALNPVQTLGRQLLEVMHTHRPGPPEVLRQTVIEMLGQVSLADPASFLDRYPHQASGGQLQRIVIAMALLARPRLLVLDEPTTGLDVTVEAEVVALIKDLARQFDMAVLYISHSLGLIARVCDRVGVMYAGELVEQGERAQVFSHPAHPYTRALLRCAPGIRDSARDRRLPTIPGRVPRLTEPPQGCAFAPRCGDCLEEACLRSGPIVLHDRGGGHQVRCVRVGARQDPAEAVVAGPVSQRRDGGAEPRLVVQGLGKSYGAPGRLWSGWRRRHPGKRALDEVSLDLQGGEILALVGESGSGKSTLAKVLVGLEQASDGHALYGDLDVARLPPRRRPQQVRAAIQMVFQNPDRTLNPSQRVGRILVRAMQVGRAARLRREDREARVRALLETVQLAPEVARAYPDALSGGQRQRVAIARALATDAALVLADEPASALDVSVQGAIMNLLLDARDQSGVAVLLISHDLALVHAVADRVVVLRHGRVMEAGPARSVFHSPHHPYTRTLLAALGAAPDPDLRPDEAVGDRPAPGLAGSGCVHAAQCRQCLGAQCWTTPPPVRQVAPGHVIHCHRRPEQMEDAWIRDRAPLEGAKP